MEISLAGKPAFVTGGNVGIGRGIAIALAKCGADVALTYYSHKVDAEETVRLIEGIGSKAYAYHLDATDS